MRRAYTVAEVVVALSLLLVMLPALFPAPRPAVQALRAGLELETARLIAAGELATARRDAAAGLLELGRADRDSDRWASAGTLREPTIDRQVQQAAEPGLLEVNVTVRWTSLSGGAFEPASVQLSTWVAVGGRR